MDNVNHPSHYNQHDIETIDIIGEMLSNDEETFGGFLYGNVIKYLDRFEHKNGIEDLKKAQWYLKKYMELTGAEIDNAFPVLKALYNGEFDVVGKYWLEVREMVEKMIKERRNECD